MKIKVVCTFKETLKIVSHISPVETDASRLEKQDHGLIPGVTQHCIIRNRFEKANAVEKKTENH